MDRWEGWSKMGFGWKGKLCLAIFFALLYPILFSVLDFGYWELGLLLFSWLEP
jgi:hypothetical protein